MEQIRPYINNEVFLLALVMGSFYLGIIVYKKRISRYCNLC